MSTIVQGIAAGKWNNLLAVTRSRCVSPSTPVVERSGDLPWPRTATVRG
ncbi:MAG: hypothetical protein K0Q55_4127 [Verrucomicrobia bacterium]|jgi:hypothetical protein|nr:hypothetical protein [Verrucomicrobiota bacterium]